MTLDEVRARVREVQAAANGHDGEKAHGLEDRLMLDFIRFVALIGPEQGDIGEMAEEVLKTRGLSFPRWCG